MFNELLRTIHKNICVIAMDLKMEKKKKKRLSVVISTGAAFKE